MADLQAEMARFEAELAQSSAQTEAAKPSVPARPSPPSQGPHFQQMAPPPYHPSSAGPSAHPWGGPPSRLPGPPPTFSQAGPPRPPTSNYPASFPHPPQGLPGPPSYGYAAPSAAAHQSSSHPVQSTYSAAPQTAAQVTAQEDSYSVAQPSSSHPELYGGSAAAPQAGAYAAPPPQLAVPVRSGDVKILAAAKSASIVQPGKKQSEVYSNIQEAFASQKASKKPKYGVAREAAGKKWVDPNLLEWPENDFRVFVGDLGNETNDEVLTKAFAKYPTFNKAKVVRDKKSNKTKGFGFVSFSDPIEGAKALREMDGKYIGNRPCKLKKSSWTERNQDEQRYVPGKKKNHVIGGVVKKKSGVLHK